jgi:hypothetical protein
VRLPIEPDGRPLVNGFMDEPLPAGRGEPILVVIGGLAGLLQMTRSADQARVNALQPWSHRRITPP